MSELLVELDCDGVTYQPVVVGEAVITRYRVGAPTKAVFTVAKDDVISFQEGNEVRIYWGEVLCFLGYVFSKKRDKEEHIAVCAYDQLRYLKNKASYIFQNKKASDMVKEVCGDYRLKTGTISDSGFLFGIRVEDDMPLLDILQRAIDDTYANTGRQYVLYDDGGAICLRQAEELWSDYLLTEANAENFTYESTIDRGTYNQVRLTSSAKKENVTEYLAKQEDAIARWGVLQLTGTVQEEENGAQKAQVLLEESAVVWRKLVFYDALGDCAIRGGTTITVTIEQTGDVLYNQAMMVEWVQHRFGEKGHRMDLCVKGGRINLAE